jgi:hypothetical protein
MIRSASLRRVPASEWFEIENPLDELPLDVGQSAYLRRLRARAVTWPQGVRPADTCTFRLLPHTHADGPAAGSTDDGKLLLACADICADNIVLLVAGAYFDGQNVEGDDLRKQRLFTLDNPTPLRLDVTGSPDELADQTAAWFESFLRRPIVRQEWRRLGRVHARRWLFSDSGHLLAEDGARTGDLGPPDRTVQVRDDLT